MKEIFDDQSTKYWLFWLMKLRHLEQMKFLFFLVLFFVHKWCFGLFTVIHTRIHFSFQVSIRIVPPPIRSLVCWSIHSIAPASFIALLEELTLVLVLEGNGSTPINNVANSKLNLSSVKRNIAICLTILPPLFSHVLHYHCLWCYLSLPQIKHYSLIFDMIFLRDIC